MDFSLHTNRMGLKWHSCNCSLPQRNKISHIIASIQLLTMILKRRVTEVPWNSWDGMTWNWLREEQGGRATMLLKMNVGYLAKYLHFLLISSPSEAGRSLWSGFVPPSVRLSVCPSVHLRALCLQRASNILQRVLNSLILQREKKCNFDPFGLPLSFKGIFPLILQRGFSPYPSNGEKVQFWPFLKNVHFWAFWSKKCNFEIFGELLVATFYFNMKGKYETTNRCKIKYIINHINRVYESTDTLSK
jgi:hypothetical protein